MNWLKENWFRVGILGVLLLIGFSFFYYYGVSLPQKETVMLALQKQEQLVMEAREKEKIEFERQELLAKEVKEQIEKEVQVKKEGEQKIYVLQNKLNLLNCIDGAEKNYKKNWENECKARGLEIDCSLPTTIAQSLEKTLENQKDDCFKLYPQN